MSQMNREPLEIYGAYCIHNELCPPRPPHISLSDSLSFPLSNCLSLSLSLFAHPTCHISIDREDAQGTLNACMMLGLVCKYPRSHQYQYLTTSLTQRQGTCLDVRSQAACGDRAGGQHTRGEHRHIGRGRHVKWLLLSPSRSFSGVSAVYHSLAGPVPFAVMAAT